MMSPGRWSPLLPEYIALYPDNMLVTFPPGALPSQEHSCSLGLDYGHRLCGILQEWGLPPENP